MIGGGHDSGIKKSNTINRRMFIFAAAKAVVFFGIVGRLFSLQISENKKYLSYEDVLNMGENTTKNLKPRSLIFVSDGWLDLSLIEESMS